MKLSDIDTIEYIRDNIYVQSFLGLSAYTYEPVFDPSLFVYIRKRLGVKEFEDMTSKSHTVIYSFSNWISCVWQMDKGRFPDVDFAFDIWITNTCS